MKARTEKKRIKRQIKSGFKKGFNRDECKDAKSKSKVDLALS